MSILLILAAAAAPDVPSEVQIIAENGAYVLRTLEGARPLYTFDKDDPGKSNCVDRCLQAWPALGAPAGAKAVGNWSVIVRPDGSSQWAYDNRPVYTFVRDSEGVATGDGMGGAWHLLPTTPVK